MTTSFMNKLVLLYYRNRWKGFSRFWQFLKRFGYNPYLITQNQYGVGFYLNPENYIDSYVIRSGYYESEVLDTILEYVKDDSIFWDIGSNFGLHAVTLKYIKPNCQVISVEPSPIMASQIVANSKLNNIQLDLINIALSDSPSFQNLHLMDGNPGMTTLKPWDKAVYSNKVLCWCDTGDNLVINKVLPQPTIIKIDVEGSELDAFMGMLHILGNKSLKAIIFEAGIDFIDDKSSKMYELLSSFGFTFKSLSRNENTSHNLDNFLASRS